MKNLLVLVFILLGVQVAFAQNLVPNNGFETNDGFPTGYGQWYHATTWSNVNNFPAFLWPYASPDYLHMTGSGGADLPVCTFGTVTPYAGNAVMGFITWLQATPEFREYLSIQLITPMVVGTTYTVSFWITNGSAGWYSGYSSNRVSARFSIGPLSQVDHEPIGGVPQCEFASEIWNTAWQYVSFSYAPDQPYDRITIGNFYNDASTSHTWHAAAMNAGAYYFIDEVAVIPVPPLPLELLAFGGHPEEEGIVLDWTTLSEMDMDEFLVERSADGAYFEQIGSVPAAGQTTDSTHYSFTDDQPYAGINYYRLQMTGVASDVDTSEVIAVSGPEGSEHTLVCYPNPARVRLNLSQPFNTVTDALYIRDLQGKIVLAIGSPDLTNGLDISGLQSGVYVIEVIYMEELYRCIQVIQ